MSEKLLYRTEKTVLYDTVTCPRCGHVGCESFNGSNPIIWHCPRCNERWNPDNLRDRKPIKVGDNITVADLRVGDIVVYLVTRELDKRDTTVAPKYIVGVDAAWQPNQTMLVPIENPYMQMTVVHIGDEEVSLLRPYIGETFEGKVEAKAEACHFRWDSSMQFRLLQR